MEEDMFKFKLGGRTSGQTFTNAMTLLKYINELQPNKMYGIMKAGTSITLLTKNEVIPKSKVKEKKEELEKELKEYEESDMEQDEDYFFDVNALNGEIQVLQELLGEE